MMLSLGSYLPCSPTEDLLLSRVRHMSAYKMKVKRAKKASSCMVNGIMECQVSVG